MANLVTKNTLFAVLSGEWQKFSAVTDAVERTLNDMTAAFVAPTYRFLKELREEKLAEERQDSTGWYHRLTVEGLKRKNELEVKKLTKAPEGTILHLVPSTA